MLDWEKFIKPVFESVWKAIRPNNSHLEAWTKHLWSTSLVFRGGRAIYWKTISLAALLSTLLFRRSLVLQLIAEVSPPKSFHSIPPELLAPACRSSRLVAGARAQASAWRRRRAGEVRAMDPFRPSSLSCPSCSSDGWLHASTLEIEVKKLYLTAFPNSVGEEFEGRSWKSSSDQVTKSPLNRSKADSGLRVENSPISSLSDDLINIKETNDNLTDFKGAKWYLLNL